MFYSLDTGLHKVPLLLDFVGSDCFPGRSIKKKKKKKKNLKKKKKKNLKYYIIKKKGKQKN